MSVRKKQIKTTKIKKKRKVNMYLTTTQLNKNELTQNIILKFMYKQTIMLKRNKIAEVRTTTNTPN